MITLKPRHPLVATAPLLALLLGVSALPGQASARWDSDSASPGPRIFTQRVSNADASYEVVSGEILMRVTPESRPAVERALARHGAHIISQGAYSGVLRVSVPDGQSISGFLKRVAGLDGVRDVSPNAVMTGAGSNNGNAKSSSSSGSTSSTVGLGTSTITSTTAAVTTTATSTATASLDDLDLYTCTDLEIGDTFVPWQWNLNHMFQPQACVAPPQSIPEVVIAVLDTGIAYQTTKNSYSLSYVSASDLEDSEIVAPWDFINDDADAFDDNGHGTHMAGVAAARGVAGGVAPGAALMPVKVLDQHKTGTEAALIEGIYHAVANGADVINMSLSFGLGYFPSAALLDAVGHAADAGVILVASTGNEGASGVGYPAALPDVIAVGATRLGQDQQALDMGALVLVDKHAEYSNRGFAVDVSAPGGRVDTDFDHDGYPDGILAQSFTAGMPDTIGHWFFAGTSPAAAHVSGAAAWLIAQGIKPDQVADTLRHNSIKVDGVAGFSPNHGQGMVALRNTTSAGAPAPTLHVNALPWIETNGATSRVGVRLTVMDAYGKPVSGVQVGGSFLGSIYQANLEGYTDDKQPNVGSVTLYSNGFATPEDGIAVGFQVDAVVSLDAASNTRVKSVPRSFYSLSPATAEILSQLAQNPDLKDALLLLDVQGDAQALGGPVPASATRTLVGHPFAAGLRSGATVIAMDTRFIETHADGVLAGQLSLSWPSPLASGAGAQLGVDLGLLDLVKPAPGMPELIVTLPYDPAMAQINTASYYPVLNAAPADFEKQNTNFGNQLPSQPLASGFAASSMGMGFASSSLGDGFAASSLGDGFAASSLGMGFAASSLGNGFAASPMGMGFAASSMGMGFAASSMGMGFAASSMGMNDAGTAVGQGGEGKGKGKDDGGIGALEMARGQFGYLLQFESELP